MSLQTDIIFVKALRADADLIAMLPAGDVYNTAIALPEEEAMNADVPYIIVSFDGLNNQDSTKDSQYTGLTDRVTIGIEVVAKTRPQLADLTIKIRKAVEEYFIEHVQNEQDEDYFLIPSQYDFQAGPVQYDELKPCYWQRLTYQCDTDPDQ